jgi:hypothetical protein
MTEASEMQSRKTNTDYVGGSVETRAQCVAKIQRIMIKHSQYEKSVLGENVQKEYNYVLLDLYMFCGLIRKQV